MKLSTEFFTGYNPKNGKDQLSESINAFGELAKREGYKFSVAPQISNAVINLTLEAGVKKRASIKAENPAFLRVNFDTTSKHLSLTRAIPKDFSDLPFIDSTEAFGNYDSDLNAIHFKLFAAIMNENEFIINSLQNNPNLIKAKAKGLFTQNSFMFMDAETLPSEQDNQFFFPLVNSMCIYSDPIIPGTDGQIIKNTHQEKLDRILKMPDKSQLVLFEMDVDKSVLMTADFFESIIGVPVVEVIGRGTYSPFYQSNISPRGFNRKGDDRKVAEWAASFRNNYIINGYVIQKDLIMEISDTVENLFKDEINSANQELCVSTFWNWNTTFVDSMSEKFFLTLPLDPFSEHIFEIKRILWNENTPPQLASSKIFMEIAEDSINLTEIADEVQN